jgi:hypothetical protein
VKSLSNIAWFKQSSCSVLVAVVFSVWVTAPVLDRVTVETWQRMGFLVTIAFGAGGVVLIGSWPRNTFAVLVGLLAAGIWVDFVTPHDTGPGYPYPTLVGVLDTLAFLRCEIGLFVASAGVGELPAWLWLRSRRLQPHA